MPIDFSNLESELQGKDLLSYLESKGFQVSQTSREIFTHWSDEFIARVRKELAIYSQRQSADASPDHQELLAYLTSWPDCPAGIAEGDIKKAEEAFRAMAQQLRSFYGREDQDDEVPYWTAR